MVCAGAAGPELFVLPFSSLAHRSACAGAGDNCERDRAGWCPKIWAVGGHPVLGIVVDRYCLDGACKASAASLPGLAMCLTPSVQVLCVFGMPLLLFSDAHNRELATMTGASAAGRLPLTDCCEAELKCSSRLGLLTAAGCRRAAAAILASSRGGWLRGQGGKCALA